MAGGQLLQAYLQADDLLLDWEAADDAPNAASTRVQQETFRRYHAEPEQWLYRLGFVPLDLPLSPSLTFWREVAATFVHDLTMTADLEFQREQAVIEFGDDTQARLLAAAPLGYGLEELTPDRLQAVWETLQQAWRRSIADHPGTVDSLLRALRPDLELAGRVFFHLVENKKGPAPFAFLATYSTTLGAGGTPRHLPLRNALTEFAGDQAKLLDLLATVYRAAGQSQVLPELLESGRIFHPLGVEADQALRFLRETPLYESCGIRCRIPNWWTSRASRVAVNVTLGDRQPSQVGLDALVSCLPELRIGDSPLTPDEARRLLAEAEGLVLIKNRWVEVDRERLQEALDIYERVHAGLGDGLTMGEAMRLMLRPDDAADGLAAGAEVSFGDWFADTARRLADPTLLRQTQPTADFRATLRPYQAQGLNWLAFHQSLGFGACLADDMGLGKTVQVLALLSLGRPPASPPDLLVVPASLLGNWQDEIARFLPTLQVRIAHASAGEDRRLDQADDTASLDAADLVITTYATVQRQAWLRQRQWRLAILDEAQAIKNPGTRQTRAIKELRTLRRLILTGTPVENRLGDLWSLFDFINPGLLGNRAQFKRLAADMAKEPSGYARLRRVISPFILRRVKTDRSIIDDLPDKVEMKSHADLTPSQVLLYRHLVATLEEALEDSDGIRRRGLVLGALMKFKQICNHPDQYSGSGDYAEAHSGKFMRLREICETIREKRERLLVFTQFREMTDPLDRFLADVFGHPGLVLHGSVPVNQRRQRVDTFQTARDYIPYLVLSVKAGGVGLNLTRANHVIHFDRWWNPAVENQATDRAFRIGQTRKVIVHKFVTRGTIEEKIDRMIADKSALAADLIADTGEAWITDLPTAELRKLFTLSL